MFSAATGSESSYERDDWGNGAFTKAVVEGIRNNKPYILTHSEFRDEVRELYAMLDEAFPRNQEVPPGRAAFEEQRRDIARNLRSLPVKD